MTRNEKTQPVVVPILGISRPGPQDLCHRIDSLAERVAPLQIALEKKSRHPSLENEFVSEINCGLAAALQQTADSNLLVSSPSEFVMKAAQLSPDNNELELLERHLSALDGHPIWPFHHSLTTPFFPFWLKTFQHLGFTDIRPVVAFSWPGTSASDFSADHSLSLLAPGVDLADDASAIDLWMAYTSILGDIAETTDCFATPLIWLESDVVDRETNRLAHYLGIHTDTADSNQSGPSLADDLEQSHPLPASTLAQYFQLLARAEEQRESWLQKRLSSDYVKVS